MITKIRQSCFETNSSSVHSLTIIDANIYDDWKEGKVFFDIMNDKFIPKEEVEKEIDKGYNEEKHKSREEYREWYLEYVSCDEYYTNHISGEETFEQKYTTKNGDTIIAFGYYGNDNN